MGSHIGPSDVASTMNEFIDVVAAELPGNGLFVRSNADFPDPEHPRKVQINRVDRFVEGSGAEVVGRTQTERGDLLYQLGGSTWPRPHTPTWED